MKKWPDHLSEQKRKQQHRCDRCEQPATQRTTQLEISAEERCWDHNIVKFDIRQDTYHDTECSYTGYRYVVTDKSLKKFDSNLSRLVATKFGTGQRDPLSLDRALALQVKKPNDIERAVKLFQEPLKLPCNKSFNTRNATKPMYHKSVTWWTKELTPMRKRTNALRRYKRTTNNNDLRERRKNQYHDEKTQYPAAIKREKIKSWKEFCNLTSATNPWNVVYKLATNKSQEKPSTVDFTKTWWITNNTTQGNDHIHVRLFNP